jgi:transcriptional regulator with XRE-family HTH domain
MAAKPELAEFLRSRRARIQPESVGLDGSGYRRVPGLRREELALLAGVSVDYYIRLEQGRDLSPSNSVLDSVARALRLEEVERAHLYALVHSPAATWIDEPSPVLKPQVVRPDVLQLIAYLKTPALVVGRGTSILACNSMLRALIADFDSMDPDDRSYAFWIFADPTAREVFEERWESYARETVGVLRRDTSRWPRDPALRTLIGRLSILSDDFREWWSTHDVETHHYGSKHYSHPLVGDITVFHEATQLTEGDQYLFLYSVEPGSPSEDAMRLLEALVARQAQQGRQSKAERASSNALVE